MKELGQLEARHQDFDSRHIRVVAVSLDGLDDSRQTQQKFPHLVVISDEKEGLAKAVGTLSDQHSPTGGDTNTPTTILIDRRGDVRHVMRPDRIVTRLGPDPVLVAADAHFAAK